MGWWALTKTNVEIEMLKNTLPKTVGGRSQRQMLKLKCLKHTLPKTDIALKIGWTPKGKQSSNHPFPGAMLVSGRVKHCFFVEAFWMFINNLRERSSLDFFGGIYISSERA